MAQISKLNRPTKERMALIRGQASSFLWDGKIETTVARAKTLQSYVEKILTLAINTYEDTVKVTKTEVDSKGVKIKREVVNDGPKKLAARRAIMSKLYDRQEQRKAGESKATFIARTADINHPLIEKIFNVCNSFVNINPKITVITKFFNVVDCNISFCHFLHLLSPRL